MKKIPLWLAIISTIVLAFVTAFANGQVLESQGRVLNLTPKQTYELERKQRAKHLRFIYRLAKEKHPDAWDGDATKGHATPSPSVEWEFFYELIHGEKWNAPAN